MKTAKHYPCLVELAEGCLNGACNVYALTARLGEIMKMDEVAEGYFEFKTHPAAAIIFGQLSYLIGETLGPSGFAMTRWKYWREHNILVTRYDISELRGLLERSTLAVDGPFVRSSDLLVALYKKVAPGFDDPANTERVDPTEFKMNKTTWEIFCQATITLDKRQDHSGYQVFQGGQWINCGCSTLLKESYELPDWVVDRHFPLMD